ncbi:hypothetical protein PUR34_18700 [Streptomyces sp. JV185]|uniref:hypothetical protein n=1 Tax=Streptomyces sp. JV185 TaxID=858638 RepID=UPI002E7959B1|nr:hypothetical protein [Streptomyces sp. JV185]MEE1770118.1 hypothetical protein [Streptomyces sp. JV185]
MTGNCTNVPIAAVPAIDGTGRSGWRSATSATISSAHTTRHPARTFRIAGQLGRVRYRVRTKHFEAAFLPDADERLESVGDIDVLVDLKDRPAPVYGW